MIFNTTQSPRHNVFVSFQHADQHYKDLFIDMMGDDIVNKSVGNGDIDDGLRVDTTRMQIREGFIRQASVTVVLIGPCTWQRKHVDWEISYSLTTSQIKPTRNGLLGMLLPNHSNYQSRQFSHKLIPPRLSDNCGNSSSYALIYDWSYDPLEVKNRIDVAFDRRSNLTPNNSRLQFGRNRSGQCSTGWSD